LLPQLPRLRASSPLWTGAAVCVTAIRAVPASATAQRTSHKEKLRRPFRKNVNRFSWTQSVFAAGTNLAMLIVNAFESAPKPVYRGELSMTHR
jgi:hypothetical protein